MSIRSLFGRKEKGSSMSNPSMPQLPSQREIIEDIENIKKNDPILSLAAILEKKGNHSAVVDTDIKELMEALQKRKRRESSSSLGSPYSPSTLLPMFNISLLNQKGVINKGINSFPDKHHSSLSHPKETRSSKLKSDSNKDVKKGIESNSSGSQGTGDQTLDYDKLKHFLTTCEHSQELISNLEPEFKTLHSEISEYTKFHDTESLSADSEPNLT